MKYSQATSASLALLLQAANLVNGQTPPNSQPSTEGDLDLPELGADCDNLDELRCGEASRSLPDPGDFPLLINFFESDLDLVFEFRLPLETDIFASSSISDMVVAAVSIELVLENSERFESPVIVD